MLNGRLKHGRSNASTGELAYNCCPFSDAVHVQTIPLFEVPDDDIIVVWQVSPRICRHSVILAGGANALKPRVTQGAAAPPFTVKGAVAVEAMNPLQFLVSRS